MVKNTKERGKIARVALIIPEIIMEPSSWPAISICPVCVKRLINKAASMGPAEAIPTSPKEFSSPCSPLRFATPRPRAMINGVVIAPVVAPEASKAMAWEILSVIAISPKITI